MGIPGGLFLLAVLLAFPVYLRGLVPLDEGSLVHVAERLAGGEVLYRDVATGVMPGAYYLQALLFRLFGPSLVVGRVLQMGLLGASVVLVYLIALRYAARGVAVATGLLQLSVALFAYRYPNYSPLAIVLLLGGVLGFLHHLERGRRNSLLLSGLALSLSFLCKQNYGLAVFLALLSTLVVGAGLERRRRRLVEALLFSGAFLAPVLAVLVVLALAGALTPFLEYTVLALFGETLQSFFKPFPILDLRDPIYFLRDLYNYVPFPPLVEVVAMREGPLPSAPLGAAVVAVYLAVPALLVAGLGSLVRQCRQRRRERSSEVAHGRSEAALDLAQIALLLAAWALFAGVYPRSDFHHLVLVLPLPLVVGGLLYERRKGRLGRPMRLALGGLALAFTLASLVPAYLPVFFALPERYDTPIAVERAAYIRVARREADRVVQVVEALRSRIPASDPLLVVPNDPLYYFLAERHNPSPYPLVLPGSFDEGRLLEVLPQVRTLLYRDLDHDLTPVGELFPRLGRRLSDSFRPDEAFLESGWRPSSRPLYLLERRPRATASGSDPGRLLLAPVAAERAARVGVVAEGGRLVDSVREEIPRAGGEPWFLEPALLLRPPSGWQKLLLAYRLPAPAGGRLELRVAMRPPAPHARPDGAVLETYWYLPELGRLARLDALYLRPDDADSWRGRRLTIELPGSEGEAVLLFAAWSGPRLEELWDELLLIRPHVCAPDPMPPLSPMRLAELPAPLLAAVSRFDRPDVFLEAMRRGGEEGRIRSNLGQLYARLGERELAERSLLRALEIDRHDPQTHLALAELRAAGGEAAAALAHYEQVLRLEPSNVRALTKAAELGLAADRAASLRRARRALRRAPRDADAHVTMGWVRLALEEPLVAWTHFLRAMELDPARRDLLELVNREYPHERVVLEDRVLTRAATPLSADAMLVELRPVVGLPTRWAPGQELEVGFEVVNLGASDLPALGRPDGSLRVVLSHRWGGPAADPHSEAWTPLPRDVAGGARLALPARLRAPERPGLYRLVVDLRQEGVAWFGERGGEPFVQEVEVR